MSGWKDKFDVPIEGRQWAALQNTPNYPLVLMTRFKGGYIQTVWHGIAPETVFKTHASIDDPEIPDEHVPDQTREMALATHYRLLRKYERKTRFDYLAEEL